MIMLMVIPVLCRFPFTLHVLTQYRVLGLPSSPEGGLLTLPTDLTGPYLSCIC
jgi:hypothetical protein